MERLGKARTAFTELVELNKKFLAFEEERKRINEQVKATEAQTLKLKDEVALAVAKAVKEGKGQTFNGTAAHTQAAMLLMAAFALIMPAVFQLVHGGGLPRVS